MKRLLKYAIAPAFAALAIAGLTLLPAPREARAAGAWLCQGDVSGASTGSRTVVVTSSTATPQPTYVLNAAGCAFVASADIGFFTSQGFVGAGNLSALPIIANTGVWTATTNVVLGVLPANGYIQAIIMTNSTANAVTGGVSVGSTANGTDIVAATVCAANCVANSTIVKAAFSLTAATTLNAAPVTAGNNANVTITVIWGYF